MSVEGTQRSTSKVKEDLWKSFTSEVNPASLDNIAYSVVNRMLDVVAREISTMEGRLVPLEQKMDNKKWTMNCVIFGAELFRSLYHGQISKDDAIAKIQNLSSGFTDEEETYLLRRVQDLVVDV